jgi:hypothetical protein
LWLPGGPPRCGAERGRLYLRRVSLREVTRWGFYSSTSSSRATIVWQRRIPWPICWMSLGGNLGPAPGGFAPVYVSETLTLDFADREQFERYHMCFHVGDAEFDAILGRIRAAGIKYRSSSHGDDDWVRQERRWPDFERVSGLSSAMQRKDRLSVLSGLQVPGTYRSAARPSRRGSTPERLCPPIFGASTGIRSACASLDR